MDIRISDEYDGEEELEFTGKADDVTVTNLGIQKPISSLKASYGQISESNEEEEFDWVDVERETDVVVTDKAPEIEEVEEAFSALQLMFNDDDDDDKSEDEELDFVDWIEPPLHLCNTTRLLQPYMLDRLYDSFHLFQTDPSVQRMVMSLASDRAVWDAVMNNEVVRELITNIDRSDKDTGSAATFIRRLFKRSAIKIIDAMETVTKYVTDLFNVVVPGDETVVLATGPAPVMEKLQMTVLLTVVVLLIVLVTRVTRAKL
ncbi:hypothetical protein AALP_AA8G445200 [Arabis alpina]|uniref:Uncharacterized protein n=1 Tax=Arabis alpina TaxID=50452 RepID=A0A087GDF2_ARAAL|nr:hypothetical protein AALP_AA8G445200 [Arabis alpina]